MFQDGILLDAAQIRLNLVHDWRYKCLKITRDLKEFITVTCTVVTVAEFVGD